jgi:hypothetical protein
MGFTVVHEGGMTDLDFEPYVRLLDQRGADLADLPRVPEPRARDRWLPVWDRREDAEAFAAELRKQTKDKCWRVLELDADEPTSRGPLGPLTVYVSRHHNGWAMGLHPHSQTFIQRRFQKARVLDLVLLRSKTFFAAERLDDDRGGDAADLIDQAVRLLTGLTDRQLAEFGGYRVYDPAGRGILSHARLVG